MPAKTAAKRRADVTVRQIEETDTRRILDGYALLQGALGTDAVEDLDSSLARSLR